MKILLLGELSGVHEELAPALRRAGHELTVAHSRLASENFESDIPFFRPLAGHDGRFSQLRDIASQLWNLPRLSGFDVVQMITPKFFNWRLHGSMMRYLKRNNGALVVVDTSCSFDLHRRWGEMRYRACDDCKAFDLNGSSCPHDSDDEQAAENLSHDLADAIVTTAYEYRFALEDTRYAAKLVNIPLPIDTKRHRSVPLPQSDKIQIYYGETRFGFKGGRPIMEALDSIRSGPFAALVDIRTSGRLPFEEYLAEIDRAHIVIDQANSHSMGMNALYALARGRIVLSGAEPEALEFLGVDQSMNPILNIVPDQEAIFAVIKGLARDTESYQRRSDAAASYISQFHASDLIAARYTSLYDRVVA